MFREENPTRHAEFLRRMDREEHERREDRADLMAYAARNKLLVRWEPDGVGGLIPKLYRLGDQLVTWPPHERR